MSFIVRAKSFGFGFEAAGEIDRQISDIPILHNQLKNQSFTKSQSVSSSNQSSNKLNQPNYSTTLIHQLIHQTTEPRRVAGLSAFEAAYAAAANDFPRALSDGGLDELHDLCCLKKTTWYNIGKDQHFLEVGWMIL